MKWEEFEKKLDAWLEEKKEEKKEEVKEEKKPEPEVKPIDYEEAKHIFSRYNNIDFEIKNWEKVNSIVKRLIKMLKYADLLLYASCGEEKGNKMEKLYNLYRAGCACFKIDEIYQELGINEDDLEDKISSLILKLEGEKSG